MSQRYRVHIDGQPVPKARARIVLRHGHVRGVTPERTAQAEQNIGWHLKLVWRQELDPTSHFALECLFVFAPTKRGTWPRVDGDNCLKLVQDAGSSVVWANDAQVIQGSYQMLLANEPCTEITFWRLDQRPAGPDSGRRSG